MTDPPDRCAVVDCTNPPTHVAEYQDLPDGTEHLYYCSNHIEWARARFNPECTEPIDDDA